MNNEKEMRDIAGRVESRRKALGLSYQDLSDATGVSKSTLQRYTTGAIKNIPLSKIVPLARALQTSPEYLMGWERSASTIPTFETTDAVIIELIEKIPADQKKTILKMLKAFTEEE